VSAPRPAPPEGRASWLDYVLDPCQVPVAGEVAHARAELAELRKDLTDITERLAKQCKMTLEAMAQRDAAQAERDRMLRDIRTYCAYCGHEEPKDGDGALIAKHIASCEAHPMRAVQQERDSLRAQVAELRGAILGLGELEGSDIPFEDEPGICVNLRWSTVSAWNEFVVKVRALPGAESKEAQQ